VSLITRIWRPAAERFVIAHFPIAHGIRRATAINTIGVDRQSRRARSALRTVKTSSRSVPRRRAEQ
jgi:hypothetical protein